jgi:hypothetical protein
MPPNENPAGANGGVSEKDHAATLIIPEDSLRPTRAQAPRRAVHPTTRREYLLSEIRVAVALTDCEKNHLTVIGVALKGGMISEEDALAELRTSPFFRPIVDGGIV